ncbi:hypothetical protein I7I48_07893 [Histoplasma ohiense]|nr:hypothetical protein I7I48_07893 [Histoplasma ohiense (nom. inval.)]
MPDNEDNGLTQCEPTLLEYSSQSGGWMIMPLTWISSDCPIKRQGWIFPTKTWEEQQCLAIWEICG